MIEEEREPPGAEEAGEERAAPKQGRGWLKIVAVAIALIVAGVGVWYFVFSNSPPRAGFTYSSIDLQLTVDGTPSLDPDGSISAYKWNWGDGSTGTGQATSHTYAATRSYDVTLTVTDARGATDAKTQTVVIRFAPTANFIARASQMTISFDASTSAPSASSNSPIATYAWAFGDSSTGTGVTTSHAYAQAKRYSVGLTVTDQAGFNSTTTRFVSPADTTVDILLDQFFTAGCPYNNYWDLRYTTYGDRILRNSAPCTDYYPWTLFTEDQPRNPSYVYTLYRWDARVRNFPGYNLSEPVMLPVLNNRIQPDPSSYIKLNLTMNYLNNSLFAYYANTSFPMNSGGFSDGFGYLVRGNITMDLTMSKRVFGVGEPVIRSPTTSSASRWSGPANGTASDSRYATTGQNGAYAVYGGYGVPQAAVPIQKVELGLKGWTIGDDKIRLNFSTDGGATWTTAGMVDLGTSNVTQFTDITSLRAWTTGLLSYANFRTNLTYLQVGATNSSIHVDWVPIRAQSPDPGWWWAASPTPGGINSGVESQFAAWLESQGNGKYDIYNGFEWYYQTDITDLNATVDADGTTHVSVFWDGFGYDVLMARWFYWGNASYRDAVCVRDPLNSKDPCPATRAYGDIQPKGWMPMESCWCEHANINGTITSHLDLDFNAIQAYSFKAWGNAGVDGLLGTPDDKPAWVLDTVLMDYVPRTGLGSSGYPNSELRWYEGLTAIHGAPGSFAYGKPYQYLVPPTRWALNAGSTLTLMLPRFSIPWYDPVRSVWNPTTGIGDYVTFNAPLTLREIEPFGDYYLWDPRTKVVSIAGPYDWQQPGLPITASPWLEFAPVT